MPLTTLRSRLLNFIRSKKVQRGLAIAIVCLTVTLFCFYFIHHPAYVTALKHTKITTLLVVYGLYILLLLCLVVVYQCILLVCKKPLTWRENGLLTIYTLLVNFFGPLQSGPGFRAIYLKNKHRLRIRDYAAATFIYYGFYIIFSLLFLLVSNRPWWQTVLALLLVGLGCAWGLRYWAKKHRYSSTEEQHRLLLTPKTITTLAAATFVQIILIASIYLVELRSIHPYINIGQAMTYSGAANFALFVSLTPGAIGFRETFLIFAEHLDRINTATVLSANVIDRSVYIVFLAILFLLAVGINLKKRLRVKSET